MNFEEYFSEFGKLVSYSQEIDEKLTKLASVFEACHARGNKIIVVGNGGSAAMASHVSVDLTKNAGVRAINFNEADLITCLSNDRGYENWVVEALSLYADEGDVVVLISSSGNSPNIVNAAWWCANIENKVHLVTVTGGVKGPGNKTRAAGKHRALVDLWVDSKGYNIIEMVHHFWLPAVVDKIIGKSEYSA